MGSSWPIRRIGVALGAEVDNIDLRAVSSPQDRELVNALYEHQVLFFHNQHLSPPEILELGSHFGVMRVSQPGRLLGVTNPFFLHERTAESPPRTERWHTDVPFVEDPPRVGILAAIETPAVGGETAWVSTYSMFDTLSEAMREFCYELKGEHKTHETVEYVRQHHGDEAADEVAKAFPTRLHPIAQVHPVTGRTHLYLGASMTSIAELTAAESDVLLDFLRSGLTDLNFQLRWRWSPGDVAIWDQRSTMHRALSDNLAPNERRVLRSVFVDASE